MRRQMKRAISLMMIAMLLIAGMTAAQADGIRHLVTGDVSEFVVDEAAGKDEYVGEPPATLHTDAYLFVDPDSASYITFHVVDEAGRNIEGAQIFISYKGVEELYGTTDENGKCSMYLFRNVEYGFRVTKDGYETAKGTFTATSETKYIRVILRKLYTLNVYVVRNGAPVKDIAVYIGGKRYTTDEFGHVAVRGTNGVYQITVTTESGREIIREAEINGADVDVVIDINEDDALVPGGTYADRFLVYNKHYNPEDYDLTEYKFAREDLTQAADETDEAFEARVARYLGANTNTILVEAKPDNIQQADGTPDVPVLNEYGELQYTQRSMMPTGWLMRAWEEQGYDSVVFTNENCGVRFDMDDMHNAAMSKVFALLDALTTPKKTVKDIATEDVLNEKNGLAKAGLANLAGKEEIDVTKIDLGAIRKFEMDFDHDPDGDPEHHDRKCERVASNLYTNSVFEYRITPILAESMRKMITLGMNGEPQWTRQDFVLASDGYFAEELRRREADGWVNNTEADELYALMMDGKLTKEEIAELHRMWKKGALTDDMLDLLVNSAAEGHLYRTSCWILYRGISVNVTSLMDGLTTVFKADELYEAEYRNQLEALIAELTEKGEPTADVETAYAKELEARTEAALPAIYGGVEIMNQNLENTDKGYYAGVNTLKSEVTLQRELPQDDDEFIDILLNKSFRKLLVDVRTEEVPKTNDSGKLMVNYIANIEETRAALEQHRALSFGDLPHSGLKLLEPIAENETEAVAQSLIEDYLAATAKSE